MEENNFVPPSDAVVTKSKKSNFVPPTDAILKKKVDSKPRSQEELWGSDSQPQDLYTSLATGAQEPQQESDGLGGPPSPPVKKKPSVLFPETPMGRPASSVMYETKQPVLVESTPFETKPNKYYRMVSDEKKAVEQQLSDLEERNTRLGRRPEDLTTEGTYQALQKQKAQLDQEFEPAQTAIKQIQRQAAETNQPFERIVYGATDGKYSYFTTDIINLNKDVEDKIIDRFDDAPEETKKKWYKGALPVEAKEAIINSAKNEVLTDKYNILKKDADNYIKNIKDNPAIPLEEKLKFQKEFKDSSDAFNSQIALDYSGKLLKNNFKITDANKGMDEAILSKYKGFIPDTVDVLSTFVEGMGQVGAKVATGIPSLALIGAERFNQLTGISKPDDYTAIEATEDWINDTTNLNFLPSSQTKRGNIVVDGEFNPSYYSMTKTLAKTLPFTLKIMSDVKKGRIDGTPQSMISQLVNPKYSKDFADKLRVVETAYKGTISDNYREAKEMGMDDSKSFLYANTMSLAEGVSENIMPDYKYFDSLTGSALKSAFKGNLKQAVTKQAAKNVTKDFFKNFVLETGEEEVILATEDALKYSLLLNHKNSEFFNMSRQKELVATTALLSGALGTVSTNQKFKQNKKDLYNSIHSNIYDLQDAFLDEIDSPLNDQKAKEALITAYKFANDVSVAVSNAPENVTADQIDLLVQKKNLEEKKKTIDTAFHPDINEEITAIDTKIRELAKIPVAVEEVTPAEVVVEEPAVEEVKPTEIKPSGQKVTDVINRPATLESQAGVKLETPIEGDVYQEGQRVIFEDKNKKVYDLGNIDEISDKTVEELGIKPQEEMVSVTLEGKVKVGENEWNMQSDLPNYGIEYDKDGNVKAISLKDDAGKTVMYEGQVAEDAAYQVLLKQTETPEQRQAINEILENDEELNRQLREAEEATQAAAAEVTEPGAPKTQAEQYSEELDKTKESDPEAYWSVSPVSAADAAKGTIIDTPDGAAIVKPDGDIAGLFKKATSKAKGVAQDLLKRAIAAGGKKLDNFDTYLTPQYIKAGFRVVSRTPFNEEYAPPGWNKELHGTPDVVAMVYDPEGKLDIEEKTFDDYDEAMAYRDSLLEPSVETELEGLAKLFDESDKGFRMSQVDKAKEALKGILPGVKFIVHETNDAYKNATGESGSGGMYIYSAGGDKVIHINKQKANGRTVAHEVFHAVILDKIKGDKAVQEITARMVDAVYKTASPELRAELDAFAARYSDKTIRDEERLAELIGIIADGYPKMSPANKSIVKRWLDALAKTFGLKPFTDNEVIDLLNTLAGKISTGEVISAEDVAMFDEEGSGGFAGVFKISRQQKGIEAPKAKDDSRSFVKNLVEDVDIREFNGEKFITNMYDYTNAGKTDLGNGFEINLFGGKGYVPYMMELNNKKIGDVSNLAAFNTQAQAETFIRNAEKSGAKLFAPHSGTKDQSWQFQQHTFAELVNVALDKNILTNKELIDTFNNSIKGSKALKETFSKFSDRYGKKIKDFSSFKSDPKKIVDLLDIKNNLSPDLRKALNNSIASNKKFQEAIGIKNKEQFFNKIMDPLNNGVTGGEIMGVVKFDPNTFEVVETKPDAIDHHPSFGYTLLAKINGIYQPTEFYKSYDVTESYTKYNTNETKVSIKSEDIKFNEKNVTSSAGAIPKVAEFKIKRSQEVTKKLQQTNDINEIVRIAKEAKYSDAAISTFLKAKGFSDAEITSALATDRPSVNKIYEDSKKAIDDKKKRVSIKDLTPFLRKSLLDRQAYIKRVINRIDNKSAKKTYDLLVTKAGASALASERFKRAEKKIYGGLSSEDVSTLDKIIYAKRMVAVNESRAKLGLEPYKGMDGYSIDDANRDLADFKNSLGDKKFNDLSNRATEYFDVFKLNLKKLYESGRISEETYESLKDTEYSPIKTIKYIIGDNLSVDEIDTQAKSLGISRNDIMKLSDNNENEIILDSKWLLAMSINSVEGRAFENNMLREFDKAIKEATPEEKNAFEDIILDNPVVGTKKDGGLKYKYDDTRLPVGYTKVSYFNDGNKVEIVLKDQYAKQLLDVKNKNKALETLGKLTGTKILRFFATGGNPLFIIGNTAVDFQNIAFFSDVYSKFKPMATAQLARDYTKNFVKKLFVSNEYNKVFNEYINHGGALDYMASDGLRSLESMNPVKGVTKAVQKGLVAYGRAMSLLGETSEVAFRLSVFQKVKEDSIKEFNKENNREPNAQELDDIMWNAGRQSRETMDFSQGGDVAKNIDAVFPYFNAALQGIRRPIDFAKNDPVGFSSSVLQYTVMASSLAAGSFAMLINAVGGDDDEDRAKKIMDAMNSLSEYEKANYHIMFTGEKNKDGEYEYYRVKKLPVLSVISTVAEQLIYKEFFNSKGIDYDMDSKVMLEAVNKSNPLPVTVQEVAGKNPVASGLVSYWANKDTFTGDKIFREPDNKKILPEAEGMFDDRVDQIYKDLAPGFGLSPARTKVMVEKVITSANTNPTIPLIYSAYDGLFNKSDGLGSEVKEAMSGVGDAFGKKVVRYTDKKIIRYKDQDEKEYQESLLETKVWNSEQKVYNEIKKKYDGGGNLTKKELIDLVKENFEPMDYMKYAKKYNAYIHNMNIDKSVLDIIFEDVPEVQAMKLNQRYGPNLEGEELKELGRAMNSAGKRINNKSIYIYNKKYKNRNKAQ
jgi:hypothetical protein